MRLKNRFARPSFNGYRDALFNLAVALPDRPPHIVEVQVHLSPILEKKAEAHEYYSFFRRHFHGNMASCDDCMRLLDECLDGVGGHTLFSVKMLEDVALSSDVAKLDALADLFEHRCSKYHIARPGVHLFRLDARRGGGVLSRRASRNDSRLSGPHFPQARVRRGGLPDGAGPARGAPEIIHALQDFRRLRVGR